MQTNAAMKKVTFIILIFFVISCQTQRDQKFNLGFERQSDTTALPDGWMKWGDYVITLDSLVHSGQKSGKISSTGKGQFGCIAYQIPAEFTGKTIELKGYIKTQDVKDGFAGLLLRIDGENGSLAFDNMQEQNISGTKDWQRYSIKLEYPEQAETIYIAGMLTGNGEAWFDDFVLSIDGKDVQTIRKKKPPLPAASLDTDFDNGSGIDTINLFPERIDNLELLGKVWGFLKYYHPEIAKGNYNWDYELFRFIPDYLNDSDESGKEELLLKWIETLGNIDECQTNKTTPEDVFLKPDLTWIANSILSEPLRNKLNHIYNNRNQGNHFYVKLDPGIGNPKFENENAYGNMPYPDAGFRLLALYRYWNIINYFFPNKYLTDKDWNTTLKEYIPIFINAKDELEYEQTAIRIIGETQDTHANLWGGNNKIEEWKGTYYAPVNVRFIENQLVVTDYYNPELKNDTGLNIGDIVTAIDGEKINKIVSDISIYYPASNEAARLRDIAADILRSQKDEIEVEYSQNGICKTKKIRLYPGNELNIYRWFRKNDDKCYRLLDNNIGYITLMSIKDSDIPVIKKEFINTRGIIIDIRNYPSAFVPFTLGSFFSTSSAPFVKFTHGNINNPGEFAFTDELVIPGTNNPYKGKLIVLVNEFTQSQAEYTAMAFRAGDNTTIVGSTTAGADGNVSEIMLPGGLKTMISGLGVYYPNGEQTQRIGIVPDIEVRPTIDGIRKGKDELLEKAIEIILKM